MISNLEEMPQALNYLISKVESLEEMVNELSHLILLSKPFMDGSMIRLYLIIRTQRS